MKMMEIKQKAGMDQKTNENSNEYININTNRIE